MAESEGIQKIINWAGIQAVTTVVMVLRGKDAGLQSGVSTVSLRGLFRQEHGRQAIEKPLFIWNVRDK